MKKNSFISLFFVVIFFIFSEELKEPSWVYLKKAENFIEQKEYAKALIEAKKAKRAYINEKLAIYYEELKGKYKNLVEFELESLLKKKENELLLNDNYPAYHEVLGDIYLKTGFPSQAIEEYKKALEQKKFFEYPQKEIEIKYKLTDVYTLLKEYEIAEIWYLEILEGYFSKKSQEFWSRIKYHIKEDISLNRVFKIYRIDGIEYLKALYKVGRRNAILQRKEDALFYLANAAIVWMTYYANVIRTYHYGFQYSGPSDFINYIAKKRLYEYESKDFIMDEIFFFIGYVYLTLGNDKLKDYYFNLAKIFSKNTDKEEEINSRIELFKINKNYRLTHQDFLD